MNVIFIIAIFIVKFKFFAESANPNITCSDFESLPVVGPLLLLTSTVIQKNSEVNFLLSTTTHRDPIDIDESDWSGLKNVSFDPSKKTYMIVHGFFGNSENPWILKLKDLLLDRNDGQVILIDWRKGSNTVNYINAARNTLVVSNRTYYFLESMRTELEGWNTNNVNYNRIYLIGHSLGAQLSGQISRLLKKDKFWNVDRITGLDPAKPCFSEVDINLKLSKEDADFVDVIHTQSNTDKKVDSLGLGQCLGHVDFYVNGGMIQPECVSKFLKLTCSHSLSHTYFVESVANANNKSNCKFSSYPWNGSYVSAIQSMARRIVNETCNDCPEMGINAPRSKRRGMFLVITAAKEPYCNFGVKDVTKIFDVIKLMKKPK